MKRRFTKILAAFTLLALLIPFTGWGQTRETYTATYDYNDLGSMFVTGSSYSDATSYWKVPASAGNSATIAIPIAHQPESNITLTFRIATFGNGTSPSSSNTTITAVGTESNSNWTGSGVSSYPSSSTYVDGVMTITKPQSPTTLRGLNVTMGVNSGVKIFRLQSITVSYTYVGESYTVTFNAGQGTFVGNEDFPQTSNEVEAGTYTLPNATRENYTLLWSDGEATYEASADYEVTEDVDFTAQWTAIPTPQGGTDELTNSNTIHQTTQSYKDWTTSAFVSGATYKGNSAGSYESIQLRSSGNSGIVSTTSGGKVTKVVVTWNTNTTSGRTLDIYGKNTAYSATSELYNSSNQGTKLGSIVYGTSTTLTISGDYNYIGLRSNSGAMYLDKVEITWGNASSLLAPAISPTQLTFVDSQEISITAPEGAAVRYTLDGSEPTATTGTVYTEPFTINNTTTVKAIAYTETAISEVTTATYTRVYTITLNQTTGGTISVSPAQAAEGATVTLTATPNVGYSFGSWSVTPSVTLNGDSFTMPASNVTVSATFTASTTSCTVSFSVNNKVEMTATTFGGSIDLTKFVAEAQGFEFNGWSETATGSVVANSTSYSPQADITLYAQFGEIVSNGYTLVTNVNQLVAGNQVVIAADGTKNVAMSTTQNSNNRGVATITKNNDNTISFDEEGDITGEVVCQFTLGTSNGHWTFYDPVNEGYIYAASSSSNNLKTQAQNNANGEWTVAISNNEATITAQGTNTRNLLRYNSSSTVFSCYASGQQPVWLYTKPSAKRTRENVEATSKVTDITGDVLVTVKNGGIVYLTGSNAGNESNLIVEDGGQLVSSANVKGTMLKSITGYTSESNGWYFISSPLTFNVNVTAVENLINESGTGYDLYYFKQNPTANSEGAYLEWVNQKNSAANFTKLFQGSGYLYANAETTTLGFAGNLRKSSDVSYDVDITYSDANPDENMRGWNLVGNPFPSNAKVSMAFYKMNSTSDGINPTAVAANSVVASTEGVFVKATEGGSNQVTFTATTDAVSGNSKGRSINIDVTRQGEFLDRAIVNINGEGSLSKLFLNNTTSKVYFRQDQKDYAIVASANENELPVSFKASRSGSYTLTVNTEDMEMNYLHLIDNMTGMDVDLLQTPSYTFNATTRDYESRFRLVFAANNEDGVSTGSTAFAFYSNGNWIINNAGEATLQVIDLTGRILSSETVNGSVSKTINAVPGVYMLRLINGENVNVQKIVVR